MSKTAEMPELLQKPVPSYRDTSGIHWSTIPSFIFPLVSLCWHILGPAAPSGDGVVYLVRSDRFCRCWIRPHPYLPILYGVTSHTKKYQVGALSCQLRPRSLYRSRGGRSGSDFSSSNGVFPPLTLTRNLDFGFWKACCSPHLCWYLFYCSCLSFGSLLSSDTILCKGWRRKHLHCSICTVKLCIREAAASNTVAATLGALVPVDMARQTQVVLRARGKLEKDRVGNCHGRIQVMMYQYTKSMLTEHATRICWVVSIVNSRFLS